MALADILQAITAEASAQVQSLKEAGQARAKELKTQQTAALKDFRAKAQREREARVHRLRALCESQAAMKARHELLLRKQEHLAAVYDGVLEALLALPDAEVKNLLSGFIKQLPEGGTIRPSVQHAALLKTLAKDYKLGDEIEAKGGFQYVGPREDRDYSFAFIVQEMLRPQTEINTANSLFATR